jgi:cobalt-zinc-cadmium efflux system membrane fusion protein
MRTIFLIAAVAFISWSCGQNHTETPAETVERSTSDVITLTPDQLNAAGIEVGKVERKPIGTTLHINGTLDVPPQNLITISAPMGGFVKSTQLLQGMKVKKGELLVTLENQEYIQLQQDYLDNKSKLEYLESEYNRQLALAKENVNAQKTVQQAKSQYQSAQAIVKGLEAKLGMINISPKTLTQDNIRSTISLYAPLNGYVTVVNVNIGQYVNAADVIFKLVNLEHLHAELQVFERDIHTIRIGQKVNFKLANENNIRTATVHLIGKEISPDRTVRVHCHLDEEDESLLPGMYITATVEIEAQEADVLPASAVVNFEGEEFVFTQEKKNQFKLTKVKTGQGTSDYIAIELPEGYDKTQPVVIGGAFNLLGLLKNTGEEE